MKNNDFYNFQNIYIEKIYKDNIRVQKIVSKINNNCNIEIVDDIYEAIRKNQIIYHPLERAKNLFLGGIRGEILRKCPGSHGHICCNYYVINLYVGCPINCSYCILQSYLNQPFIIINVDIENIFNHLKAILNNNKDKIIRIGTGELGDSLVYDYLTGFSIDFVNFFSQFKNAIFEFKTKTDFIDNLLKIESSPNIVIGFSVNPQSVIDKDETNAASLINRLKSAELLLEHGYKIALHFDPLINIDNFDYEYENVIKTIFNYIDPDKIAWLSLGTFRYTPDLKNMIEYNYPESRILSDEFIECNDRKFRYFKPVRETIYNKINSLIYQYSSKIPVYLCMESPQVWNNVIKNDQKDNLKILF